MANDCPECYTEPPVLWREQEMNEELRHYASTYMSSVKQYYPSLEAAMAVWGTTIEPEDILVTLEGLPLP